MQLLAMVILDLVNPEKVKLANYCNDGPIGSFLEVDLLYPDELHDFQNDYLLATKEIKISKEIFSKLSVTSYRKE